MSTAESPSATLLATLDRVRALVAAHPDLPVPMVTIYSHRPEAADLDWYLHVTRRGDETVQREHAQQIIRTIGGHWDKSLGDTAADFRQERDGLSLCVTVKREAVCTRRIVGTEVREIVEWDCGSLLGEAAS